MPELLEKLKARTSAAKQAVRGPAYNHPDRWYMRSDGDVVKLQADPQNRAYYEDKGYAILRDEEVEEWLGTVRPEVLAAQRTKAAKITMLRQIARSHPLISLDPFLDDYSVEDLDKLIAQVGQATGSPVAVLARPQRVTDEREPRGDAEIGDASSLADKIARGAGKGR